jgi:hypothetical protein
MFGAAGAQGLPYVECAEDGIGAATGVCSSKNVTSYPSWQINGKVYAGLQTLPALQALSGFDPAVKFPEFVPPGTKPKPKPPPGGFRPPKVDGKSSPEQIALSQHLSKTGARFYGAYWCRYCDKQRQMFGAEVFVPHFALSSQIPGFDALLFAASVPASVPLLGVRRLLGTILEVSRYVREKMLWRRPLTGPASPYANFLLSVICVYIQALKQLPYIECDADGYEAAGDSRCRAISGYPTWEIKGKFYGGYKSLDALAQLSGFQAKQAERDSGAGLEEVVKIEGLGGKVGKKDQDCTLSGGKEECEKQ